jgi:hypothetical protein
MTNTGATLPDEDRCVAPSRSPADERLSIHRIPVHVDFKIEFSEEGN